MPVYRSGVTFLSAKINTIFGTSVTVRSVAPMAKDVLPVMPFFVRDYIASTRHLTLEQRGAYTDLLFFQWDTGPLPAETNELARMLGASPEQFSSIWSSIGSKFKTVNGTIQNLRVEIERKKSRKKRKVYREKAKTAANARWHKGKKKNASSMHEAMLEDCPPNPNPKTLRTKIPVGAAPDTPLGTLKTQIFRLGRDLGIDGGVITPQIEIHGEPIVWGALGQTVRQKPGDNTAYFLGCMREQPTQAERRRRHPG
jgi:uncharacterized protein YdaU (DUF1376 family)